MPSRIRIAQSALNRAGELGLSHIDSNLSRLLKKMARLSAIASGNFNDQRRRYGAFILTMRGTDVVDINCNDDYYCEACLGLQVTPEGEDCFCLDEMLDYDDLPVLAPIDGNHW
jgi:hypothetical protein